MLRQITFFKVSWIPKQCTGIFKVSNAWTDLWNNMIEEKAGLRSRIPGKDSKRMSMPCSMDTASPYSKVACPTQTIQTSEIRDTQLGLTGSAN